MRTIDISALTASDLATAIAVSMTGSLCTLYDRGDVLPANQLSAVVIAAAAKDASDLVAAKAYAKLAALITLSPADVATWVTANVTTLPQAQDAIKTLAVAVSVLARRL